MRGVLADLFAADLSVVQDASTDNLDGVLSGAMATGHLHVHLRDGTAEGNISVLLVHVDGTRAGQVAKNDTVVPDSASLLLKDLAGRDDFTLNFANLVLPLHVVPELGPGENGVPLEDTHSVEGRVWVRLRGEGTTHNVELSQLSNENEHQIRHHAPRNERTDFCCGASTARLCAVRDVGATRVPI